MLLPALQINVDLPLAGVPGAHALTRSVPPGLQAGLDAWLILALAASALTLRIYVVVRLTLSARRWRTNRSAV
ncbi:MAG TPA: hypothetical protein VMW11_07410 [Candidatus Dormibacteraeota bacterium]|nr:hypothetical protein [Candidatus Dormibacteraeota bacterium]